MFGHAFEPMGYTRGQKAMELATDFFEKPDFEVTLRDKASGGCLNIVRDECTTRSQ